YLISVSGVGPKTALSIFSVGEAEDVIKAITMADVEFFTSVPRLGKKNAQKIIIELKGKLGSIADLDLSGQSFVENKEVAEVLKNLGFTGLEINKVLKEIKGKGETPAEKVKLALKYLGK
ncbi:MAG: Holliday junction branch migration protein RuvA, partial [Candidatus Levybacteria bacterium]|nr:Holliday junction branch migration protein RuvA [Candidatus Levybacteria bacterium]